MIVYTVIDAKDVPISLFAKTVNPAKNVFDVVIFKINNIAYTMCSIQEMNISRKSER